MKLKIKTVDMDDKIMSMLEERDLIARLRPGNHRLEVSKGESNHYSLYESEDKFGPHKIISVTINSTIPKNFLFHNENEEFWLIDSHDRESLIIVIALVKKDLLNEKIKDASISGDDFIGLRCKFCDPNLSFFIMKKHVAHVEIVERESEKPPSFYVTESRDIDENFIDLLDNKLDII
ncbi:MAG: hypothetical protein N4A76_01465 [Firmicutes bacterium]|jgi:hypothetical protein|nr:hypothetical protein [Bacillota bacterium]